MRPILNLATFYGHFTIKYCIYKRSVAVFIRKFNFNYVQIIYLYCTYIELYVLLNFSVINATV